MNLRAPDYPLITIDPYFSVWSDADKLTDKHTSHWTGVDNKIIGVATIDGTQYRVMGISELEAAKQVSVDMTAFSTTYIFEQSGVRLTLKFTSPLLPNDLYLLSRPVSYLWVFSESIDGKEHAVSIKLSVSEEICMNKRGDDCVDVEVFELSNTLKSVKMGTKSQKMLCRAGDDLRIEWGYFYLSTCGNVGTYTNDYTVDDTIKQETFVYASADVTDVGTLFTFSYDDIKSIEYFGEQLTSYWNKDGAEITDEIVKAHGEYGSIMLDCEAFEQKMFAEAVRAGGEKYAELLELAFRQTLAAHKLVIDGNGEILYISKECYSNGCAGTVDVSYPSIPMFLIYNPELVKGMMRPIYKYAQSDYWKNELKYDFAPHDVGCYPLLNGQVYGISKLDGKMKYESQMPVEECGNMLIMEAAVALSTGDISFANSHIELLEQWVQYLLNNGADPENQLCTDDFAGHLAHNCNLSLKAIMGIAGLGIIYGMNGNVEEQRRCMNIAREMALDWADRAHNGDGSYKLAFDAESTFSMKYNIVWDKLFGTQIMPKAVIASELASYKKHMQPYGMPLDSRKNYTKSDWTVWTATLAERREDFEAFIEPMWNAYNFMPSRVPMADWYDTDTGMHHVYYSRSAALHKSFRNRTVQGGLFIKLLEYQGIMKLKI